MKLNCPNCNGESEMAGEYIAHCFFCGHTFPFTESIELSKDSNKVIEMNICEVEHIVLHANRLYRFLIDPNCEKCKRMNVY